jgi:DNA invertase Pin-like site-specific DNA recombinase
MPNGADQGWVAQMELDGMKERMTMGVKARLRSGKANTRAGSVWVPSAMEKPLNVVEEEAVWVKTSCLVC